MVAPGARRPQQSASPQPIERKRDATKLRMRKASSFVRVRNLLQEAPARVVLAANLTPEEFVL